MWKCSLLNNLLGGIWGICLKTLETIADVDAIVQAVVDIFSKTWSDNATEKQIIC